MRPERSKQGAFHFGHSDYLQPIQKTLYMSSSNLKQYKP